MDIVFPSAKVAVFVHGCFWHSCPIHVLAPKNNAEWWADKLDRTKRRDEETERQLSEAGWSVEVVWEHELPSEAAARICEVVRSRRAD